MVHENMAAQLNMLWVFIMTWRVQGNWIVSFFFLIISNACFQIIFFKIFIKGQQSDTIYVNINTKWLVNPRLLNCRRIEPSQTLRS